jgi:SNF family Na+-dependent transporter
MSSREGWGSRVGLVLAVAGNAVGSEISCGFPPRSLKTAVGHSLFRTSFHSF